MMRHNFAREKLRVALILKACATNMPYSRTGKPIIHNSAIRSGVAGTGWVEQEEA